MQRSRPPRRGSRMSSRLAPDDSRSCFSPAPPLSTMEVTLELSTSTRMAAVADFAGSSCDTGGRAVARCGSESAGNGDAATPKAPGPPYGGARDAACAGAGGSRPVWWGGWKGASASSFRLPAALGGGGSGIGIGVGPRYEPLEIWRIMSCSRATPSCTRSGAPVSLTWRLPYASSSRGTSTAQPLVSRRCRKPLPLLPTTAPMQVAGTGSAWVIEAAAAAASLTPYMGGGTRDAGRLR
mmetsp:Transcript_21920/g.72684  ORF Transcript_21920/g.72684 Transcript_21920/m.72684 type:complete len:239 (+) Transcript_21920:622-1338(+)